MSEIPKGDAARDEAKSLETVAKALDKPDEVARRRAAIDTSITKTDQSNAPDEQADPHATKVRKPLFGK